MKLLHTFLRRPIALFFLCWCFLLGCTASSLRGADDHAGFSPEKLERVTQLLNDAVTQKRIAGGSALIARHGKVVFLTTVGM